MALTAILLTWSENVAKQTKTAKFYSLKFLVTLYPLDVYKYKYEHPSFLFLDTSSSFQISTLALIETPLSQ